MASTQTATKSARKSAAAKPIPSKVMTPEQKADAEDLKLQGAMHQTSSTSDVPEEVRDQERREHDERRRINPDSAMEFIAQNLLAPVVQEGADPTLRTPEQLQADFKLALQERAAEFAKEHGIEDTAILTQLLKGEPVQAPKMQRLVRNNITRPGSGTKTGTIWDAADAISAKHPGGTAATIAELKAYPTIRGMNDHTIKTQYARWRAYHGVTGRITAPLQAQQTHTPFVSHWGDTPAEEQF